MFRIMKDKNYYNSLPGHNINSGGLYHLVTTCSVIGSSILSSGSGPLP